MLDRRSFLRLIPLGLLLRPSAAGGVDPRDPEAVARALFDAFKKRPEEFVASVSSEGLKDFREAVAPSIREAVTGGRADEVLSFFDVRDMRELDRLDDAAFLTAFWSGLRREIPAVEGAARKAVLYTFGRVEEGDVAHVIYWLFWEGMWPLLPPNVISLRRTADDWVVVPDEMEGAEELRRLTQGGRTQPEPAVAVEAVGSVPQDEGMIFVVYRARVTLGGFRMTAVRVHGVAPQDSEWKMLQRTDMEALNRALGERFGKSPLPGG